MAVSSGQNDGVSKTVALLRFVMVVDNGTAFTLLGLKFPPKCTFAGSPTWGWIAYSVGTLLGARTAAPERRHILFVSDGSFLVTAAGAVDETARTPDWIRRNATGKR